MFNRKQIQRLKNQVEALTIENEALQGSNRSLANQREGLQESNKELRKQISDLRAEYNGTLDAKEIERQELCDELEATKKELEQARCTIDKLQAKVARKGCPRDEKGHFIKKEK
jgi:chromosome segregation ATPase